MVRIEAFVRMHDGVPGFRVLTIAKSADRVDTMIQVLGNSTGSTGSNVFLFADTSTVSSVDPFATDWITGNSHLSQLLE